MSVFDKMRGTRPLTGDVSDEDLYDDTAYALELKRKTRASYLKKLLLENGMRDVLSQARIAKESGRLGDDDDEYR